jgi:cation:H+ antiporter
MDWTILLQLAGGLTLLVIGAEVLIRGASRIALAAGISPLVVGLTVVAYGTSAPELAVSVGAGLDGRPDLAVGNIVGSNIFNVLFILGACAVLAPLSVSRQLVWRDVPLMVVASVAFGALAFDGRLGLIDGALLTAGVIVYTVHAIRESRREGQAAAAAAGPAEEVPPAGTLVWVASLALVTVGLGLLVLGARWLVDGAVVLATRFGISELVVGLTIVAAGTSLPEVATSLVATLRGQRDIAVGNVIGSSIYNLLVIGGVASLVTPGGLVVAPAVLAFDLWVMLAVAVACLPIFFTGHAISRWEGAVFLGYYVAYTAYLVLAASGHAHAVTFRLAMTWFVLPLTALTLAVVAWRAWWTGHGQQPAPAAAG